MKKIVIHGGRPLKGEVTINGAKNSVVALIPAVILADDIVTLDGVPDLSDVDSLIAIMIAMGASVTRAEDSLTIWENQQSKGFLLFLWKLAWSLW